jgi:hypothetical protein
MEVAAAAATQVRDAFVTQSDDLTALRAGFDLDLLVSLQRRDIDLGTEGGLREVDVQRQEQVILIALEDGCSFTFRRT